MVRAFFLFSAVLTLSCVQALGGEASADPVLTQDGTQLPSWLTFIFSFEFVWKALVTVVGALLAWGAKHGVQKAGEDKAKADAVLALEAGVNQAWEEFVKNAREAAKDGKLTKSEKESARNLAIQHAKAVAAGPGLKMLNTWGRPVLDSLIKKIVNKFKGGKKNDKKEGGS